MLKIITDIRKIDNKTILDAKFVDAEESLVIVFDDNTCIYINVDFFGGSHSLELTDDIDSYNKLEAGIITKKEYDDICKTHMEKINLAKKKSDLELLAKLKAEYE